LLLVLLVVIDRDFKLRVISSLESIVSTDIHEFFVLFYMGLLFKLFFFLRGQRITLSLSLEVKEDHLNVLLRTGFANKLNGEFLIFPVATVSMLDVFRFKVVVDSSSVAIFFFESLSKHTLKEVFRKIAIFLLVEFWLRYFTRLEFLSFRLLFGFFKLSFF